MRVFRTDGAVKFRALFMDFANPLTPVANGLGEMEANRMIMVSILHWESAPKSLMELIWLSIWPCFLFQVPIGVSHSFLSSGML